MTPTPAALYELLEGRLGPQGWWPAETAEEMVIGAVLTQAVAWRNAARAIAALRADGLCSLDALALAEPEAVARRIRPAGYYNVKARKLRALARFVRGCGGLAALAARPPGAVRRQLLGVYGVGPETADAILCYALDRPAMVADAYARRVLGRVGAVGAEVVGDYGRARDEISRALPPDADAAWVGEFHALLVEVGKQWCRPRQPACPACPARPLCAYGAAAPKADAPSPARAR